MSFLPGVVAFLNGVCLDKGRQCVSFQARADVHVSIRVKGTLGTLEMKIRSSLMHPHVGPDVHDILSSVEHKGTLKN